MAQQAMNAAENVQFHIRVVIRYFTYVARMLANLRTLELNIAPEQLKASMLRDLKTDHQDKEKLV